MEQGFFVGVSAMALEVLLFITTLGYVVMGVLQRKTAPTSNLWWTVVVSALFGAIAFSLSAHYVLIDSPDPSWVLFVLFSVLLPLLLGGIVARVLRRQPNS
jgi:hypothetical protein